MRGTPKNIVGCTSLRFSGTFSIDSAKYTAEPTVIGPWMVKTCSAMCESGRYERLVSLDTLFVSPRAISAVQARFSCESITPLGGPVVPDV